MNRNKLPLTALRWLLLMLTRFAWSYDSKTVIFVVGCQRSGTTMLLDVLGHAPQVKIYHEGDRRAFDKGYRLKSDPAVQSLIRRSFRRIIAFKPLNDSQHTDRLLKLHPRAKAIWIYRNYPDVINSAITKKWGNDYQSVIQSLSKEDNKHYNQIATERLSLETRALIRRFGERHLSSEEAAALIWYIRNVIYFERSFQTNRRVLLCKYEDLVTKSEHSFQNVFAFVGCAPAPRYWAEVHQDSVAKSAPPVLSEEFELLCSGLVSRLNRTYEAQRPP